MDKISVLLVDDEEELSLVLAERLQMRDYDAEGVMSAEAALERLKKKTFKVIVIDVKMPGIGGLELMRKIKQQYPHTRIILFTGHGSAREGEQGIAEGAFDYLIKPVKIENLIKKINDAVTDLDAAGG